MVKREHKSAAAICSIIRSRPKRIRRSGSRASLDVKGSFVMKKVWMFEGISNSNIVCDDEDQLSDRDTGIDESCLNHCWFLFTNLSYSQHCAKCTKRILPHRASYKCTACKQICHLKCAIKTEEEDSKEGSPVDDIEMDMADFVPVTNRGNVPKQHSQTRNVARLRKQMQEEDSLNNTDESRNKQEESLNNTEESKRKSKFSNMKHNIVKRCKSIKEKVGKKKKEAENQVDDSNTKDHEIEERIEEEREAWVRSPVRTRLKSRREQLTEKSGNIRKHQNEQSPEQTNTITERRRRNGLYKRRPRARGFLHEYELTIGHIRDRLDNVEEKIKQLETSIPTEINKWRGLQQKYREDSFSQLNSIPVHSIESETTINHETCVKQLEAENNLPSVSSGTASDEIYLVKDRSTSSNEYVDPLSDRMNKHDEPDCHYALDFQDENSMPSGIPAQFISGNKAGTCGEHQTSTPVTDRDLAYLKSSRRQRTHSLKHTSITTFKLDKSPKESRHDSFEQEKEMDHEYICEPKQNVLSPEQLAVKHFLNKRNRQSRSMDKSNLSSTSPMASSTFRYEDDSILASQTSPFSFTYRDIDCSRASYTKMLDDSKLEGQPPNTSHQDCSSNLSCTFRNDSQMVPTQEDEDLPGYTRNHSFHTYRDHRHEPAPYDAGELVHEDMYMADAPVQYTEIQIPDRPESSMLTDRTSLTNVTRPTGDFINSFDEKSNRSKWANKEVLMFHDWQPGVENRTRSESRKIDEKGDNGKPPLSHKSEIERNFLFEAEEKLRSFKVRRNSYNSDIHTVGVCMENQPYSSDGEISNDECPVQEVFVKEEISERQQCLTANIEKKFEDIEYQVRSRNSTLQEFEKMEKLCQNDSLEQNPIMQRNKTSLSKLESQIIVDSDRVLKASVSRTSSMESKCSAKYHFLHDKGMIKIDSPSLKIVSSSSPEKHRQQSDRYRSFEEESTDLTESDSETDGVCIDNDFRLGRPDKQTSTDDLRSEDTVGRPQDAISETDETDSQIRAEEQMLNHSLNTVDEGQVNHYLNTVDEGQETWDNVMKWMHRECDDTDGEELEAELKLMIEQGDDIDVQQEHDQTLSDDNQDDSIYYSFQTQPEDIRQLIAQDSQEGSLTAQCQNYYRNGELSEIEEFGEDANESASSSNLMYTIIHGTVDAVEKLLNSDRTISESEIKEGLIWALNHKHLQITLLLLEDICKLLRAAEEEGFVDVFAAYSEKDRWDPLLIVLSKTIPVKVWDTFMELPVYRRKHDQCSSESYLIRNQSLAKTTPLPTSDRRIIREVIERADLHKYHSQVTMVNRSTFRSKREGKELVKQTCIAIHCLLKGFIPFGEDPFPREIDSIPTDVRETFYNMELYNQPTRSSPIKTNKILPSVDRVQNLQSRKLHLDTQNNSITHEAIHVPKVAKSLNRPAVRGTMEVFGDGSSLGTQNNFIKHADILVLKAVKNSNRPAVRGTMEVFGDGSSLGTQNNFIKHADILVPKAVKNSNRPAVRGTMEVFGDGSSLSDEPLDIVLNEVDHEHNRFSNGDIVLEKDETSEHDQISKDVNGDIQHVIERDDETPADKDINGDIDLERDDEMPDHDQIINDVNGDIVLERDGETPEDNGFGNDVNGDIGGETPAFVPGEDFQMNHKEADTANIELR